MRWIASALAAAVIGLSSSLAWAGDVVQEAQVAAAADGLTTLAVIAQGGVESNPIMPANPIAIVGITVIKGMAPVMFKEQAPAMRTVWGGAAFNNLLVLAGCSNPVSLIGGVLFGAYLWKH